MSIINMTIRMLHHSNRNVNIVITGNSMPHTRNSKEPNVYNYALSLTSLHRVTPPPPPLRQVTTQYAAGGETVKVVISGLSNTYSDYITTYEEYQVQIPSVENCRNASRCLSTGDRSVRSVATDYSSLFVDLPRFNLKSSHICSIQETLCSALARNVINVCR